MLSATRDAVRLKTGHISRGITLEILIKLLYAPLFREKNYQKVIPSNLALTNFR